jgi:hypothetical protein
VEARDAGGGEMQVKLTLQSGRICAPMYGWRGTFSWRMQYCIAASLILAPAGTELEGMPRVEVGVDE